MALTSWPGIGMERGVGFGLRRSWTIDLQGNGTCQYLHGNSGSAHLGSVIQAGTTSPLFHWRLVPLTAHPTIGGGGSNRSTNVFSDAAPERHAGIGRGHKLVKPCLPDFRVAMTPDRSRKAGRWSARSDLGGGRVLEYASKSRVGHGRGDCSSVAGNFQQWMGPRSQAISFLGKGCTPASHSGCSGSGPSGVAQSCSTGVGLAADEVPCSGVCNGQQGKAQREGEALSSVWGSGASPDSSHRGLGTEWQMADEGEACCMVNGFNTNGALLGMANGHGEGHHAGESQHANELPRHLAGRGGGDSALAEAGGETGRRNVCMHEQEAVGQLNGLAQGLQSEGLRERLEGTWGKGDSQQRGARKEPTQHRRKMGVEPLGEAVTSAVHQLRVIPEEGRSEVDEMVAAVGVDIPSTGVHAINDGVAPEGPQGQGSVGGAKAGLAFGRGPARQHASGSAAEGAGQVSDGSIAGDRLNRRASSEQGGERETDVGGEGISRDAGSSMGDNQESVGVRPRSAMAKSGTRKTRWTVMKKKRSPPQAPWTAQQCRERESQMLAALLTLPPKAPVEEALDPWVGRATRVELAAVLRELGGRRRADLALGVYHWMERQAGRLKPNGHVSTLMLSILGRASMLAAAVDLFARLAAHPVADLVPLYNAMLATFCRQGLYPRALALFEEMPSRGCQPDVVTFNTLISGGAAAKLPAANALSLLARMREEGVAPNVRTYNAVLAALSAEGQGTEAAELFQRMQQEGVAPDLVTFNTLISVHGRSGQVEEAVQVFEAAQRSEEALTAVTYTALMDAYSRGGRYLEAVSAFEAMAAAGIAPDRTCYGQLLAVHREAGRAEAAEAAVRSMAAAGLRPNAITYSTLIQAYGRQGMFEEAARVFREMQARGCPADVTVYNILMDVYAQEGLPTQAAEVWRRMEGQGLRPNVVTYNTLIHAHFKAGQPLEAEQVFVKMGRDGCKADKVTLWLMMRTYNMMGWYHKAMDLKKRDRRAGASPGQGQGAGAPPRAKPKPRGSRPVAAAQEGGQRGDGRRSAEAGGRAGRWLAQEDGSGRSEGGRSWSSVRSEAGLEGGIERGQAGRRRHGRDMGPVGEGGRGTGSWAFVEPRERDARSGRDASDGGEGQLRGAPGLPTWGGVQLEKEGWSRVGSTSVQPWPRAAADTGIGRSGPEKNQEGGVPKGAGAAAISTEGTAGSGTKASSGAGCAAAQQ